MSNITWCRSTYLDMIPLVNALYLSSVPFKPGQILLSFVVGYMCVCVCNLSTGGGLAHVVALTLITESVSPPQPLRPEGLKWV